MFYEELTAPLYRWISPREELTVQSVEDTSPNQIKVPISQSLKVLPRTLSPLSFREAPQHPASVGKGGSRDFVSALDLPQKIRKSFDCLFKMRRNQLLLRRDYSENRI